MIATANDTLLTAGAATRTINPPLGAPLIGYPTPRPNTGIESDLEVRAVAFGLPDEASARAGIIVLDSIGVDPKVVARIRAAAVDGLADLPPTAVMVAATHTHSAPPMRQFGRLTDRPMPSPDPQYVQAVVDAAGEAFKQAWANRQTVRMRQGRGHAELGSNRRVVDESGQATNVWRDPQGKHPGFTNPAVPVVALEGASAGEPALLVASFGCHPVTLGPGNDKCSPDYPGHFRRELEKRSGAKLAIHLTGAAAETNPRVCLLEEPSAAKRMGAGLAEAVIDALPDAQPCDAQPILSASAIWRVQLAEAASQAFSARAADAADGAHLQSEIQALRVGDVVFVSAPGELFAKIGTGIEALSTAKRTVVVSCANDYLGYLFTDEAKREGGYEPRNPISEQVEKPLLAAAREALAAVGCA